MKLPVLLLSVSLFACLPACSEDSKAAPGDKTVQPAEKPKDDCANCPDAAKVSATPAAHAEGLQKGFTLADYTPISKILAAPADFEGKRVLVKGEAVFVCPTRGCFVTLKSDAENDKALFVKVEDGEIVFPATIKGKPVEAEGIVEKVVTPEAKVREAAEAKAKKEGKEFDPASVKGDKVSWQLRGLAAKF